MDARIKSGHDERVPSLVPKKKLRLLVPEQPQPLNALSLLLVADAVDRAGPVVGDEHRTILGENDVGRPAEIALVALKPARCENFQLVVFGTLDRISGLMRVFWRHPGDTSKAAMYSELNCSAAKRLF